MMKKNIFILLMLLVSSAHAANNHFASQAFEVLSYHDVKDSVDGDLEREDTTISTKNMSRHFAWLQAHGYHPISVDDLLNAQSGKKPLPPKPILLTFDDGYESFYTRVYPLLKLYQFPAVSALVGSWLQVENGGMVQYGLEKVPREHFLTTLQIKEMADSGLVEFASHTYDLHYGILANPQGNIMPAAVTLQYNAETKLYETQGDYRNRIKQDFIKNNEYIQKVTGKLPRLMVWPYGAYSEIITQLAVETGMPLTLTLNDEENASTNNLMHIDRYLIGANPTEKLLSEIEMHPLAIDAQRVMHIDLDYVYDKNTEQMNRNIDVLIDRVKSLAPTTVYLQAFSDLNGDGVAEALYFPNRHVAIRADIFSRVSWQLMTRANVKVYAWMPVLAFELKDKKLQTALQVVSSKPLADKESYKRLSPYSSQARQIINEIYSDLGAYTKFSGILFHDDAMLSEDEDDSEYARAAYQKNFKLAGSIAEINQSPDESKRLVTLKSKQLTDFTVELANILRNYQPGIKTARNIYASAVLNPDSERWLGQNYENFLATYDYTAVMAMPYMENAVNVNAWLETLVAKVSKSQTGLQKTVFELQAKDWNTNRNLDSNIIKQEFQVLNNAGARHVGYYPDDFLNNHPDMNTIRPYISSRDFPYLPTDK
jgi:poly-beta-1,6-N-acetyl-D-glucosamine N-deacetylase